MTLLDLSSLRITTIEVGDGGLRYSRVWDSGSRYEVNTEVRCDAVTHLDLSRNLFKTLPEVPCRLIELDVGSNTELEEIAEVPETLEVLAVSLCFKLRRLPSLPLRLRVLEMFSCRLRELPPLPETLEELWCSDNLLESLPPLPPKLVKLGAEGNRLTRLPDLPQCLEDLACRGNPLRSLPPLPGTLRRFEISTRDLEEVDRDSVPLRYRRLFAEELFRRFEDLKLHRKKWSVLMVAISLAA